MAFIVYLKDEKNYLFSTLHNYIAGFAYYFKSHNLPDATKDIRVKELKKGLERSMNSQFYPKRKQPFKPEYFISMLDKSPPITKDDYTFYLLMSILYFGFLRISEAISLRKHHINFDEEGTLIIHIFKSKTDQNAQGSDVFIPTTNKSYSPHMFLSQVFPSLSENDKIFPKSKQTYSRMLKNKLRLINLNEKEFGFHSFRRGAAYTAAINGAEDSVIKAHGRWLSECYVIYVNVKPKQAGNIVANLI